MHQERGQVTAPLEPPKLILDIFSELQCARPWPPDHERRLLAEGLEQADGGFPVAEAAFDTGEFECRGVILSVENCYFTQMAGCRRKLPAAVPFG